MEGAFVEDLRVELLDGTPVVRDVSFAIAPGRVLGLVGESGSGKTTAAMSLLAFARPGSRITRGRVLIEGTDVLKLSERELTRFRGARVAFVPQDPAASLNPALRIEAQIEEVLRAHSPSEPDPRKVVRDHLALVHLDSGDEFMRRYPHQLSGGQQQRVAIAMALISRPSLVVLDEPTTGLDVTTQARVLEVIDELRRKLNLALLYVTHDLGVVSHFADEIAVMYGGRLVELGPAAAIFERPAHPYTAQLIAAMPRSDVSGYRPLGIPGVALAPGEREHGCPFAPRCPLRTAVCDESFPPFEPAGERHLVACFHSESARSAAVGRPTPGESRPRRSKARLRVEGLSAGYKQRGGAALLDDALAVAALSFDVAHGECLALVGESGSGKTTVARCILGIHRPSAGRILLDGTELAGGARRRSREERRRIQVVFQNPEASLNPRHSVHDLIARPIELFFRTSAAETRAAVVHSLDLVRLDPVLAGRVPGELSGGEQPRVAIARALAARPDVLVCDEVTSALDVSVQAAILELISDLRAELEMSVLFISHDLAIVRALADRILVMKHGRMEELHETDLVFESPESSYTRELMVAERSWAFRHSGSDTRTTRPATLLADVND
jgi:peptide/nickel transport system ATP-binding protein